MALPTLRELQFAAGRLDKRHEAPAMTLKRIHHPVLNSLLYIRDARAKDLPAIDGIRKYWFVPSCLAVSCLPDSEGNTEIVIGDARDVASKATPLFDGALKTPSRKVIVETVIAVTLLEWSVPEPTVRLRIWTNGHQATEWIVIGLG
jgi:hypothetical protein